MALSMFPLSIHSSPQHSVLNKNWLPSRAWKAAATRIAVESKGSSRSQILCSGGGGDAAAADAATTVRPEPIDIEPIPEIKRSDFPPDFFFGASTSAYQIEGAWNEGGKGPSIWDTFTHEHPEKIWNKDNGDRATDSYHRYKEDVKIMRGMGVNSYRFSISWSRILPDGTKDKVNHEGIHYYNNLINELLENGITPFVTLFHWDVPQALEEKYGGFRSKKIVNDFEDFARVCFTNFGDRVKHWITLNGPWTFSINGYCTGYHAPGRCTPPHCADGNSGVDPYTVSHHLILAHAHAVKLYKDIFQAKQKGEIGITLVSFSFEPYSDSDRDKEAAKGTLDFMLGWYMDPIVNGHYPIVMREILKDRLPKFSEEEKALIEGSYDFIGINYYTSFYAQHKPAADARSDSHYVTNNRVLLTGGKPVPTAADNASSYFDDIPAMLKKENVDGEAIGEQMCDWIYLVPKGITNLLLHIKGHYKNPNIYITENGTCDHEEQAIEDDKRIDYITDHLIEVNRAMNPKGDNVSVKGYFIWSIIDNFEWEKGYKDRFGLVHINYDCDLERTPKKSADWFTSFLRS